MPVYFFDLTDRDGFHSDAIGEEFDSFEDARQQCQTLLRDIIREELPSDNIHVVSCDMRDDSDRTVYRARITFQGEYGPE